MKQKTFCLISPVRETDPLFYVLSSITKQLRLFKIPHSVPKLNWHITHVTPFQATEDEIKWFALGLTIGEAMSKMGSSLARSHSMMTRETFDFYENPEEDALILRLAIQEEFRDVVSRARVLIHGMTNMNFPPKSFDVNFHVTVAQGKGLRKNIESEPRMMHVLKDINPLISTGFNFPVITRKEEECWVPVVV